MADTVNGSSVEISTTTNKPLLKFISSLNDHFSTPDNPPKCTWHQQVDPSSSPHTKAEW